MPISTSPGATSPRRQQVAAARPRRPACRRCRTRPARRRRASRPSRRRAARSRPPRTPRPCPPTTSATLLGVELAGGDVVEEEQRPRALHEHVVDAVVDDVDADAAVAAEPGGELDLGADAVGAGDEHRVVHRLERRGAERAAEAADAAQHRRAVRALDGGASSGSTARAPSSMSTPAAAYDAERRRRGPASRCRGAPACPSKWIRRHPRVGVGRGPRRGRRRAR